MKDQRFKQLLKRHSCVIEGLSTKLTSDKIEREDLRSEGTLAILSCNENEEKYLGRKIKFAMINYLRRNNGKFRPDFFPIYQRIEIKSVPDIDRILSELTDSRLRLIVEKIINGLALGDSDRQYWHRNKTRIENFMTRNEQPSMWQLLIQNMKKKENKNEFN